MAVETKTITVLGPQSIDDFDPNALVIQLDQHEYTVGKVTGKHWSGTITYADDSLEHVVGIPDLSLANERVSVTCPTIKLYTSLGEYIGTIYISDKTSNRTGAAYVSAGIKVDISFGKPVSKTKIGFNGFVNYDKDKRGYKISLKSYIPR